MGFTRLYIFFLPSLFSLGLLLSWNVVGGVISNGLVTVKSICWLPIVCGRSSSEFSSLSRLDRTPGIGLPAWYEVDCEISLSMFSMRELLDCPEVLVERRWWGGGDGGEETSGKNRLSLCGAVGSESEDDDESSLLEDEEDDEESGVQLRFFLNKNGYFGVNNILVYLLVFFFFLILDCFFFPLCIDGLLLDECSLFFSLFLN